MGDAEFSDVEILRAQAAQFQLFAFATATGWHVRSVAYLFEVMSKPHKTEWLALSAAIRLGREARTRNEWTGND